MLEPHLVMVGRNVPVVTLLKKREAFIVVRAGEVTQEHYGTGYAPDRYVEWGSITKLVTAQAAAEAVARGLVGHDDPVRDLLGVLPASVTLRGLLTHTSGVPRIHQGMASGLFSDPYARTGPEVIRERLAEIEESDLISPGESTYSNLGYAVVGQVLETVCGRPWIDCVRELVLIPMGLSEVSVSPPVERRVHLLGFDRKPHQPWALAASAYAPAGALWSPMSTLARYGELVERSGDHAIPERAWQRDGDRFWHNGQTRDSGSCLILAPDQRLVVVGHTLGRLPGSADRLAQRLLTTAADAVP